MVAVVLASGVATTASAQIISTSIPYADRTVAGAKRSNFHVMVSPFAKWKYGEVYIGVPDPGVIAVGSVSATPNSDFLIAGEGAFALGDSPWTITIGGWYNKVGSTEFDLDASYLIPDFVGSRDPGLRDAASGSLRAELDGDLNLFEGHAGVFYKDFGIQFGIVKTSGDIGGAARNVRFVTDSGRSFDLGDFDVRVFSSDTTDWDAFGVYKRSGERWGVSVGAGVYGKQGIASAETSPLRSSENQTVFSAFVSGNVEVWKGLGIDASYWFIGETGAITTDIGSGSASSDSQSRLTFGIGYSF